MPIEDRVDKAKKTIAELTLQLEDLQSEREDLERSFEQIRNELGEVDDEVSPLRVRLREAEAVLAEAAELAERQLDLFR